MIQDELAQKKARSTKADGLARRRSQHHAHQKGAFDFLTESCTQRVLLCVGVKGIVPSHAMDRWQSETGARDDATWKSS